MHGNNISTDRLIEMIEKLRLENYMMHVNDDRLNNRGLYDIYGNDLKVVDISLDRFYYKKYIKVFLDYFFAVIILLVICSFADSFACQAYFKGACIFCRRAHRP